MATNTDPWAAQQARIAQLEEQLRQCTCRASTGQTGTFQQNADGSWTPAIPEPYYYGLFPFIWKRMTGWRDTYGRKAQLFWED